VLVIAGALHVCMQVRQVCMYIGPWCVLLDTIVVYQRAIGVVFQAIGGKGAPVLVQYKL